MANTHTIKTLKPFFDSVWSGDKRFEIRYNDRNYQVGDTLELVEQSGRELTGRKIIAKVTYSIWRPVFGLRVGWILMSIQVLNLINADGSQPCTKEHNRNNLSNQQL